MKTTGTYHLEVSFDWHSGSTPIMSLTGTKEELQEAVLRLWNDNADIDNDVRYEAVDSDEAEEFLLENGYVFKWKKVSL